MAIQLVHFDGDNNYPKLALWEASETTPELREFLPSDQSISIILASIPLEKRRREWLTTRILLQHLCPEETLSFLPNGKPILNSGKHISISHSGELAGIIIHQSPVGLDIQPVDEKLFRIRKRFCHVSELEMITGPDQEAKLAMIWSAKEAVFKCFGEGITFATDMIVQPFSSLDKHLRLEYCGRYGKSTFHLMHRYIFDSHIVHTI